MIREKERSPRRREIVVEQEAILAGHIRDLLRAHPNFHGNNSGLEVETWLIDLNRCFAMYPYGSNTKDR